ncbi:hypothetical protein ACJX0J_012476, partial [Zea mays]
SKQDTIADLAIKVEYIASSETTKELDVVPSAFSLIYGYMMLASVILVCMHERLIDALKNDGIAILVDSLSHNCLCYLVTGVSCYSLLLVGTDINDQQHFFTSHLIEKSHLYGSFYIYDIYFSFLSI